MDRNIVICATVTEVVGLRIAIDFNDQRTSHRTITVRAIVSDATSKDLYDGHMLIGITDNEEARKGGTIVKTGSEATTDNPWLMLIAIDTGSMDVMERLYQNNRDLLGSTLHVRLAAGDGAEAAYEVMTFQIDTDKGLADAIIRARQRCGH